jgi:hypothetical protein
MKEINYIDLFDRNNEKNRVLDFLSSFSTSIINQPKGLYILGPPGSGKTHFVKSIIPSDKYDIISYDASDIRTKSAIPEIIGTKLSNCNVLHLFNRKQKQTVILMDEMDYMNAGDKGGIKELIKYTRAKKTKKQQQEVQTSSPIIYIGTNDNDKKVKELISVCHLLELSAPTDEQIERYIKQRMPSLAESRYLSNLVDYTNHNLWRLDFFIKFYKKDPENINILLETMLGKFNYQTHTKSIVKSLYNKYVPISDYNSVIRETDRTTLGLLWHENIATIIPNAKIGLYKSILDNLCVADYIDRIIFQNQIWQLSEQNSFIKTFYNNYLLHKHIDKIKIPSEIIFTKVLTKYSTEYNNYCFLQQLEQKMFCNKEEILRHFIDKSEETLTNKYYLQKLDIDRMKRFIDNGRFSICV